MKYSIRCHGGCSAAILLICFMAWLLSLGIIWFIREMHWWLPRWISASMVLAALPLFLWMTWGLYRTLYGECMVRQSSLTRNDE